MNLPNSTNGLRDAGFVRLVESVVKPTNASCGYRTTNLPNSTNGLRNAGFVRLVESVIKPTGILWLK